MKALITGASSGIGKSIAIYLSELGYEIIAVGKDKNRLNKLKEEYGFKTIEIDLNKEENCIKLYELSKDENIDILVNNAGFGAFGEFNFISLEKELDMINVNIKAVHILTKLFLKDFIKKDKGYILNVASIAAFQAGPLMATYYSTKAYVLRLTLSIYEELRRLKSNVKVSVLCPGPVDTNFNDTANVKFKLKGTTPEYVAKYAIDKMFRNKLIIIPTLKIKLAMIFSNLVPYKLKLKIVYRLQDKKR